MVLVTMFNLSLVFLLQHTFRVINIVTGNKISKFLKKTLAMVLFCNVGYQDLPLQLVDGKATEICRKRSFPVMCPLPHVQQRNL